MRILLVDDDVALTSILREALRDEGFAVELAYDGLEGLRRIEATSPDLVVLDVMMPEMDGLEVCRRIRKSSRVPIILLTSRGEEVDRINGLELGADDYVVKPFSTRELIARIRAVARRVSPDSADPKPMIVGELEIDPAQARVAWRKEPVEQLTRSEFALLSALVAQAGNVLSRDRLIDWVRGNEVAVTERTIDTLVKRVRQKLRAVDAAFDEIETVFGMGYRYRR
jgi:DNA-binding response OmpR family regulator